MNSDKTQKEASARALELLRASQAVNSDLMGNGSAPLLSAREVCAVLGRSHASLYRDIAAGRIKPPVKVGSSSRWPACEIRALIENAKAARNEQAA